MENENSYRYVDGNIVYTSVKNPQGLFKYPIGRQGRLSINGENVTNIDSNKPFINAVDIDWNGAVVDGNLINTTTDLLEWIDSKEGGSGGSQGTSGKEYYELINYYLWSETTPATVSTRALLEQNGWRTSCPNRPNNNSILWLYYVSVVKDENGIIIKEGRLSGPVPISGVNGSAGEDLVDREYIYLVFRTVLDFGVGNSNPYNWEINNQDDYLGPSGSLWQDHPSGVSNEWPYEYMSWRDKNGNSWGRFHVPILWSHYGVNGMDGDGVEYVFVRTSVDTAPVVSDDLPSDENPRADEFLPKVEIVNGNGMISGSVASYSDGLNKKITRCTDNPVGVDSVYRYEWVLQRKTEVEPILDNGVIVGERKVWKEYPRGTAMAKWGVYSGDSLVTIQNGQLFINGTATNIWVEGANGHGVEILNVPDFSPSDPSTWPRNTYVGQLIQCGGHIYVYLNGGWQDLGEAYGAGKYVHIAYADSLTFSGTQITACTGFAVDAGSQPKNWFGIYSDGNELDAGTNFPSNVTISENENNPEVYNGETRLDIINKYKWNYTVGKDGNGVEYIYCVSAPGHIPDTPSQSLNADEYLPIITENHNDVDSRFYNFGVTVTEGGQQVSKWTDDPIVTSESTGAAYTLSPTFPILWWSQRKKVNGVWLAFSKPVEHDTYTTSPEMYSIVSDYSVIKKDGETYTPGSITFTQMYYKENYAIRTEKYIMGYYIDGDIEHILFQDNSPSIRTESITLNLAQLRPLSYIKVGLYQLPDGNETPSTMVYQSLTIPVMSNGVSYYNKEIYKCIKLDLINNLNQKPANVINPPGWSTNINIVPSEEDLLDTLNPVHLIMYTGVVIDGVLLHYYDEDNHTEIYWTGPYDLGTPNNPGEDGLKYEFIYKRSQTPINWGDTPNVDIGNLDNYWDYDYPVGVKPSLIYHGYVKNSNGAYEQSLGSRTTDDWIPKGWTDNPQGVGYVLEGNNTVFYKYEYCAVRTRYKSNNWNAFSDPFVWSVYGEKGTDGDGVEYVFARTKSEDIKPYTIDHPSGDSNYLNTDYLPVIYKISSSDPSLKENAIGDPNYNGKIRSDYANNRINDDYIHWSDDPQGVTLEWPVEWVIKRKKVDEEWLDFQSEPAIWAKYGFNSVRLALDNEHEDFLYSGPNSNAPISPSGGATSLAHLYDGSTEITQDITWYVSCNGGSNYSKASDYDTDGSLVKARISSSGLLTVSHIKANSVKVKVKAIYNRLPYYAEFTANKTNLDKYDLKLVPNAIAFNSSDTWSNKTITPSATRTDLLGNVYPADIHNSSSSNNLKLYYDYVKTDGTLENNISLLDSATFTLENNQANNYIGIYFELRLYNELNYRLCDYETVEIVKSSNGPAGATFKIIEAYKYGTSAPKDTPSINTITSSTVNVGTTLDSNVDTDYWYLSMSNAASNAAGATILYVCKGSFKKNDSGDWVLEGTSWDGPTLYSGKGISSITNRYAKSSEGTSSSDLTAPSDTNGNWQSSSPAVDDGHPFLWVEQSTYFDDSPNDNPLVKYYCVGKKGDRGIDAKDVEFVYIRTKTNIPPVISSDSYTDHNGKTYTSDDYLPKVSFGSGGSLNDIQSNNSGDNNKLYECTDDPKGVDDTWKFEWEAKRTKGGANIFGIRSWNNYSGTMSLYNNYAEQGPQGPTGPQGPQGDDAFSIEPANVIINQNVDNPNGLSTLNEVVNVLVRSELYTYTPTEITIGNIENIVPSNVSILDIIPDQNETTNISGGTSSFTIAKIGKYTYNNNSLYYDRIRVSISVKFIKNGTTITLTQHKVNIYINLLGTWKESIKGDTKTEIADKLTYGYNNPNLSDLDAIQTIGKYVRSSENNISTLTTSVNGILTDMSEIELTSKKISLNVYDKEDLLSGNLLSDTKFLLSADDKRWYTMSGRVIELLGYDNYYKSIIRNSTSYNGILYQYLTGKAERIKPSRWYTLSFYVKNSEENILGNSFVRTSDNSSWKNVRTLYLLKNTTYIITFKGYTEVSGYSLKCRIKKSNAEDTSSIYTINSTESTAGSITYIPTTDGDYEFLIQSSYNGVLVTIEELKTDISVFLILMGNSPYFYNSSEHFIVDNVEKSADSPMIKFNATTDWVRHTITFKTVENFSSNMSNRYFAFRSCNSNVPVCIYHPRLEVGKVANEYGDEKSALKRTGIDIESGKITATADKFEIQNSNGDTTFSVDEDGNIVGAGNASFGGTISAKSIICAPNTYKAVCLLGKYVPHFDSSGNVTYEKYYYCIRTMENVSPTNDYSSLPNKTFELGKYYYLSEINKYDVVGWYELAYNDNGPVMYGSLYDYKNANDDSDRKTYYFIECSGTSDIIISSFLNLGYHVHLYFSLPKAVDYKGKLIEVRVCNLYNDPNNTNNPSSLIIYNIDYDYTNNNLKPNFYRYGLNYSDNPEISPGSTGIQDSAELTSNGLYNFLSVNYGNNWIWVQL